MFLAVAASCNDQGYVGKGVWYMRVTNTSKSYPVCIRTIFMLNRDPWNATMYGSKDGWTQQLPGSDKWLPTGQSTEWLDMGDFMTTQTYFKEKKRYVGVHVGAMYTAGSANTSLKLKIDIAKGQQHSIVRTIDVDESNPNYILNGIFLNVPPKLPTQSLLISPEDGEILTFEEAAENQLKWVMESGAVKNPPVYCWFVSAKILTSGVDFKNPSRLAKTNLKIAKAIGYTNLSQYLSEPGDDGALRALGYPTYRQNSFHGYTDDHLTDSYKNLKTKGLDKYVGLVSFGDEVTVETLQMPIEKQDARFVEWVKNTGRDPLLYVRPEDEETAKILPKADQWSFVKLFRQSAFWRDPEKALRDLKAMQLKPNLVYDSYIYRHELWFEENKRRTDLARQFFGKDILTGSNYNSCSISPSQWVDMFRNGGLTTPWAEDWWWDLSEVSPQSWGLVFGVMRRAAAFHNTPMIFYTIPDNAEPADHLLRMNYFAIANQVKHLNHFCIYHQGYATCDYVEYAQSKAKFAVFQRIAKAVGKVDKRLYYARMRPAQVAIIFTKPGSVWSELQATCDATQNPKSNAGPVIGPGNYTLQQEEMRSIWLALRHAGIPVDVITDDDIANGYINRYKAAFLVGSQIQRSAVPGLVNWTKRGGTLVGLCGGGLVDEYQQSILEMNRLYGITSVKTQQTRMVVIPGDILHIGSLATEEPLGIAKMGRVEMQALCMRSDLNLDSAKVLSLYSDKKVAAASNSVGKGRAVLCGFLPGLAYVLPALVMTEQGYPYVMPENYPMDRRQSIVSLLSPFKPVRPVTTSDYLVEATVQDGKYGSVVTLVSFRNKPARVTVSLKAFPNAKKIVSTRLGALTIFKYNGISSVTLNVDAGDILTVD